MDSEIIKYWPVKQYQIEMEVSDNAKHTSLSQLSVNYKGIIYSTGPLS
jgi:hypothetical protein